MALIELNSSALNSYTLFHKRQYIDYPIVTRSYILNIFIILLILNACINDEFKDCCLEARSILLKGMQLLEIDSEENVISSGKIESTITRFNNQNTKRYLKSKEESLSHCYLTIKQYFQQSNENSTDALFMLAFINEMTYWLSGQAIEDRRKYIRMIKTKDKGSLSEWMMDDVFAPFINNEHTIKDWLSMDSRIKYKDIYDFLMVPKK